MRLLLLDQFSEPGGAQQCLLEWLPAVRERGWSAVVGLPGEGPLVERVRELGFDAERIHCGPYNAGGKSPMDAARFAVATPLLAGEIRRLAKKARAELVYVNGPRLLPGVALAGLRVPVVFHSHSYLLPGAGRRMAGMALRRCGARAIASCRFVAEQWEPFVPAERVTVIYNGVAGPAGPARPRAGGERAPTIACIGRIAPEKGQREFVEAASLIRRAMPECRCAIYGAAQFADAGVRRYEEEVRSGGARVGVEFGGWVTDIYQALGQIDLLLVPSAAHEATTRTILEAYAAGVPVVAFRSGGIPEVVEDGREGWLADSVERMARLAVDALSGDAEMLAAVSRRARETWERRFTLGRYHRELFESLRAAPCDIVEP